MCENPQVKALAAHPYGCRVVQRVLEHCSEPQRFAVLDELMASPAVLDALVCDQYGNYVVQHVIQYGRPPDRAAVLARVQQDLFAFAQHKFASNVVEKCLQFGGAANRVAMVDGLLAGEGGPHSQLMVLIRDQYANYVVQKVCTGARVLGGCSIWISRGREREKGNGQQTSAADPRRQNMCAATHTQNRAAARSLFQPLTWLACVQRVCVGFLLARVCACCNLLCACGCVAFAAQLIDLSEERQLKRVLHLLHDQLPAVKRCAYGKHIVVRLERATGQRLDGPPGSAPTSPMAPQHAY